jgi:hypothetical protein
MLFAIGAQDKKQEHGRRQKREKYLQYPNHQKDAHQAIAQKIEA